MKRSMTLRNLGLFTLIATTELMSSNSDAQRRRRPRGPAVTAAPTEMRTIPIPAMDAYNMFQRMRVWIFTPPEGATQFGLGATPGARVWALLPSCQSAREDGRDPCPVDRVTIEMITGTGQIQSVGPTDLTVTAGGRRVMSFVVPLSVEIARLKIMKSDGSVRYEAAVHTSALHNLPNPEGAPRGNTWAFDLTRYPAN